MAMPGPCLKAATWVHTIFVLFSVYEEVSGIRIGRKREKDVKLDKVNTDLWATLTPFSAGARLVCLEPGIYTWGLTFYKLQKDYLQHELAINFKKKILQEHLIFLV